MPSGETSADSMFKQGDYIPASMFEENNNLDLFAVWTDQISELPLFLFPPIEGFC